MRSIFAEIELINWSTDLHKIYFDDESYNKGHGKAYEFLGINPDHGAIVLVRPDQCAYLLLSSNKGTFGR